MCAVAVLLAAFASSVDPLARLLSEQFFQQSSLDLFSYCLFLTPYNIVTYDILQVKSSSTFWSNRKRGPSGPPICLVSPTDTMRSPCARSFARTSICCALKREGRENSVCVFIYIQNLLCLMQDAGSLLEERERESKTNSTPFLLL